MHLRIDRLSAAVRSRRNRSLILLVIAIGALLAGVLSLSLVLMTLVDPRPQDAGAAMFCAMCGGGVPIALATGVMLARWRYERGTRELQALFTEAHGGRVDRGQLVAQGWSADRADRVLLDALAHGLLAEDSASARPWAPTPRLAGPTPPAPSLPAPSLPGPSVPAPPLHAPGPAPVPGPGWEPPTRDALPVREHALARTRAALRAVASVGEGALTGRVLKGTYLVEEALGQGGMGAVWAGRHLRTGRRVAVKTLLPTERLSHESILRFEREARAASAIGHAGIVAVHDFDRTDDGVQYLVMDLLSGETLEARLGRAGRLEWPQARRIALEIAEALEAAHRGGILHRDLKPANVFLSVVPGAGERAVLVDFGLARPIEESASPRLTSTGAVVGTALYMSPEQARGDRALDARSDLYSFAAMVYEMVAGVPPFLGSSALAVMTMVLAEQPVAPSFLARVPAGLDEALLCALAKNPEDRPRDVASFARALAAI